MIVNKLTFHEVNVSVLEIRLPISTELFLIQKHYEINYPWWYEPLVESNATNIEYPCLSDGVPTWQNKLKPAGIRPVLIFKDEQNVMEEGSEFLYANHLFKVFGHQKAVCETMIGYVPYVNSAADIKATLKNSNVSAQLSAWTRYASSLHCSILKVVNKQPVDLGPVVPGLLNRGEITNTPRHELKGFKSYWVFGRQDEYKGSCVNPHGDHALASLSDKKIEVLPVIRFTENDFGIDGITPAFRFLEFEKNGFFFKQQGALEFALCKNTIGTSCYSTGIAGLSECSEKEFYEDSEVALKINKWFKALNKEKI